VRGADDARGKSEEIKSMWKVRRQKERKGKRERESVYYSSKKEKRQEDMIKQDERAGKGTYWAHQEGEHSGPWRAPVAAAAVSSPHHSSDQHGHT
jgi:hypothetical protein